MCDALFDTHLVEAVIRGRTQLVRAHSDLQQLDIEARRSFHESIN